jgi:hypothetical protein
MYHIIVVAVLKGSVGEILPDDTAGRFTSLLGSPKMDTTSVREDLPVESAANRAICSTVMSLTGRTVAKASLTLGSLGLIGGTGEGITHDKSCSANKTTHANAKAISLVAFMFHLGDRFQPVVWISGSPA